MNLIGNILWFFCGGLPGALLWCLFGALAYISIIGIPWGRACFVMAGFVLHPFGRVPIPRSLLTGRTDLGTGLPGRIGNIIWFVLAGLWIALSHIAAAVPLALSIIGIPFAWQHVKLAELALLPIGRTVVSTEVAAEARRREAERILNGKSAA